MPIDCTLAHASPLAEEDSLAFKDLSGGKILILPESYFPRLPREVDDADRRNCILRAMAGRTDYIISYVAEFNDLTGMKQRNFQCMAHLAGWS